MKIGGIIAEYNPFHNGHKYQIDKLKQDYGITHTIVVMSGNFVQRGDVAIVDKFKRSKMAVLGGADLVIELPTPYVLSSAEFFALGGVYLLNSLGCVDTLSFGSTTDIETLSKIFKVSEEVRNSKELISLMESGLTFPSALSKLLNVDYSTILSEPNNVLGLEYIRALNRLNSKIEPITITRKSVQHHSDTPIDGFASASYIRKTILNGGEVVKYVPNYTNEIIIQHDNVSSMQNLERVILYKLRVSSLEDIQSITDVSQGLEYRILKSIKETTNLQDLLFKVKSKRYTLARIRRIILNLLLGITKQDLSIMPPYARVLSMNQKGIEILSKTKKTSIIPVDTSLARLKKLSLEACRFAEIESTATDIYNLSCNRVGSCALDYTHKMEIIK